MTDCLTLPTLLIQVKVCPAKSSFRLEEAQILTRKGTADRAESHQGIFDNARF